MNFDARHPNAFSNVSRMYVKGINDRLGLGLTDAQLEMRDTINSELAGY